MNDKANRLEAYVLIRDLKDALALERGGGTPITSPAYIQLHKDAMRWLSLNMDVVV